MGIGSLRRLPRMKPLTYLTVPYSYTHENKEFVEKIKRVRYETATRAAAWLMNTYSWNVFSPITHSHPLHAIAGMRGDWEFWKKVDTEYIECSCRLVNLVIPGWRESIGVTAENEIAKRLGIPVLYLHPRGPDNFLLSNSPESCDDSEFKPDLDGEYEGCVR